MTVNLLALTTPIIKDDDSCVRYDAADALVNIGKAEPKVITSLLFLLQDDNFGVRSFISIILGNIGRAKPEVITLIENWLEVHCVVTLHIVKYEPSPGHNRL